VIDSGLEWLRRRAARRDRHRPRLRRPPPSPLANRASSETHSQTFRISESRDVPAQPGASRRCARTTADCWRTSSLHSSQPPRMHSFRAAKSAAAARKIWFRLRNLP